MQRFLWNGPKHVKVENEIHGKEYNFIYDYEFYLRDMRKLLLEKRPQDPTLFMATYFQKILKGIHTVGRDYEYIKANTINRLAFIRTVRERVENTCPEAYTSAYQMQQMVYLECVGFASNCIGRASKLIAEVNDGVLMDVWGILFVYEDFFETLFGMYEDEIVEDGKRKLLDVKLHRMAEKVKVMANSYEIRQKYNFAFPPEPIMVHGVLSSGTFTEFLRAIVFHPDMPVHMHDMHACSRQLAFARHFKSL